MKEGTAQTTRGIAFLPWLTLDAERKRGRFRLVPYRVGRSDNAVSLIQHAHIDQALRIYRDSRRKPLKECVLLAFSDGAIGADLSEADVQDIFIFGELLAFSALAQRRFFQNGLGYVSRDHYALLVQQIPEHFSGTIALTTVAGTAGSHTESARTTIQSRFHLTLVSKNRLHTTTCS